MRPSGCVCTEFLEGKAQILLLGSGNVYECAAMDVLIREAGGYFGSLSGKGFTYAQNVIRVEQGIVGLASMYVLKDLR